MFSSRGRQYFGSRALRQGAGFALASLTTSVLGGMITAALARVMSVDHYAVYSFSNSVLSFTIVFFEFGLLVPAARRLAIAPQQEHAAILGAATLVLAGLSVVFSLTVFALSFVIDAMFTVQVGDTLRVLSVVAASWLIPFGLLMLAQGVGRLGTYSAANVASRALCLIAILALLGLGVSISPILALLAQAISVLIAFSWMLARLHPTWGDTRQCIRGLVRDAREYGFSIYVGRVLAMGTYNMDVLMLGVLARPHDVAFYALAGSIALPVSFVPAGLSAAFFSDMTRVPRLRRSWILATGGFSLIGGVAAAGLAYPFVHIVLGSRYAEVIGLVVILALAQVVSGVTRLFNSFLWAYARGRELRMASIGLMLVNLILNFVLIPKFGAAGAAWASVLALIVNLILHFVGYRRIPTTS